ncbi:hypothetical protein TCAL_11151 [Tigriopus californicus]|uniref:Condensin-2 complex subunit H2 n=2 Tax=Tigriopus californicus TaxID=6832 RepID=A0A553N9C7_TIGCA|nr:hypothetical protein TCAL_11151 [Tigriopus californicus]|eukprot:TCALIF_11151-PA protein Name:"Similar to NCAPH2 Condensin-2 complex subunit H2 (Homo sapiens)" AED:0.15 eAED:0.18 QI:0/-1/0/1/-1/1/1/0/728
MSSETPGPPGPPGRGSGAKGGPVAHLPAAAVPWPLASSGPSSSQGGSGGSSWPSSWEDQVDARFQALLRPIKDLTENWQVPLSRYLEDYMEELSDLRINLEGGQAPVNFAQAALLLQGTASVYSKKVEFLWQNVLKMLDLLASQKALDDAARQTGLEAGKSGRRGGRRLIGAQHDFNDFSLITADLARNTNLKTDALGVEKARDRKVTLNFITVTPRQLIEKEGKEQKVVRVNLHTRNQKDLLGQKDDYRINAQFTLNTGMLGEDLTVGMYLAQHSVSLFDESSLLASSSRLPPPILASPLLEPSDFIAGSPEPLSPPGTPTPAELVPSTADKADSPPTVPDKFDEVLSSPIVKHSMLMESNCLSALGLPSDPTIQPSLGDTLEKKRRRDRFQENLDETKAPLEMPWEPINPEEAMILPKPAKRAKPAKKRVMKIDDEPVRRKPGWRSKKGIKTGQYSHLPKVTVPVEEFLIHDLMSRTYEPMSLMPDFNVREDSAVDIIDDDLCFVGPDTEDHIDPVPDLFEPIGSSADSLSQPSMRLSSYEGGAKKLDDTVDSYEELVMKRVAAYVQQSQDYILSTDLAKKVSSWHDQIRPRLEAVEKRGNFDIHLYGSHILSTFPEGNAKTTVPFEKVVENQDREEVCRYFLSSLMLANTYNIDLAQETGRPKSTDLADLPMDGVELTLLSKVRHHEDILADLDRSPLRRKTPAKGKGRGKSSKNDKGKAALMSN